MLTEKQTNFIITILFLIPITGVFSVIANLYLQQRCKEFGSYWGVETKNRFFSSCQFKDKKGEWQPLKNFIPFVRVDTLF